jgi:hypothetical protein
MPQSLGSAARRAVSRPDASRRPRDPRRVPLTLLLGLALLGGTVRPAQASTSFYDECVATVDATTQACYDSSTSLLGKAACVAAGTVGTLACAAAEAARLLATGIRLPNEI